MTNYDDLVANRPGVKTHLLYSHGNAADIGAMHDFLVLLRDYLNVNVLHYEYIGYGLAKDQVPISTCYKLVI